MRHLSVGGASGAPGPSIRTYEWGPLLKLDEWKRVETREEGRMISQGELSALYRSLTSSRQY